jgi:hypothetical protein
MDLVVFPKEEMVIALRALRAVASANGAFTQAEADLVEGLARLHGENIDAGTLAPITPSEVAQVIRDPHRRKRVVQLAIVTSLIEGPPGVETDRAVAELACALEVPDGGVRVIHDVVGGHAMLVRFDIARRMYRFVTRDEGFPAWIDLAKPALGLGEDEAVAARYRALGDCAPGTLGRALHAHYVDHGFRLPGESSGIPERMIFHDVGHVLSGYGVDPQGEIQQAAFQAGFVRHDGFLFLLFGILQFHIGIRLTPIAASERGFFDVQRVLQAVARGAKCKIDLSDGFDLFAHAHEPLAVLRERWGIPPLAG